MRVLHLHYGVPSIRASRNNQPTKCLPQRGENGGGLCRACPIIPTAIFQPVKAKTISMPTSRNYLHLERARALTQFLKPVVFKGDAERRFKGDDPKDSR